MRPPGQSEQILPLPSISSGVSPSSSVSHCGYVTFSPLSLILGYLSPVIACSCLSQIQSQPGRFLSPSRIHTTQWWTESSIHHGLRHSGRQHQSGQKSGIFKMGLLSLRPRRLRKGLCFVGVAGKTSAAICRIRRIQHRTARLAMTRPRPIHVHRVNSSRSRKTRTFLAFSVTYTCKLRPATS